MGIRIHRTMGYGLTDVKVEDYEIVDDRFNKDGKLISDPYDYSDVFTFEGFKERIVGMYREAEENDDIDTRIDLGFVMASLSGDKPWLTSHEYDRVITWDPEFGLENVVCFTPPTGAKDWRRFDDHLDYYLEGVLRDTGFVDNATFNDGFNWCQVLDVPFYPHYGYISRETGKRADRTVEQLAYSFRNAEDVIKREQNNEHEANMEVIEGANKIMQSVLDRLGCEKHWTEKYTTIIPSDLVEYIRYNKIFVDESTTWQLKPMIYTYWS